MEKPLVSEYGWKLKFAISCLKMQVAEVRKVLFYVFFCFVLHACLLFFFFFGGGGGGGGGLPL